MVAIVAGSPYLIICRHAAHDQDDRLTEKGMDQSVKLGKRIKSRLRFEVGLKCSCIVTSNARRAIETGQIVSHCLRGVPVVRDERWTGGRFFPDPLLMVQVQCAVRNAWMKGRCVVVITHSEVIDAVERLFYMKPYHGPFKAARLGSDMLLSFPALSFPTIKDRWMEESPEAFRGKAWWVERMVRQVGWMWPDLPSPKWGHSRIVNETVNWVIREDVWAMDKWQIGASDVDRKPLTAITRLKRNLKEGGGYLRCLRDLTEEHIDALEELDERFDDRGWVKYIVFPPFVWKLHVHIQPWEFPVPFNNMYRLKDVIAEVRRYGAFADRPLLVRMYA